ncbi:ABC transporter ATP-binding protein [Paraburkholderia sp.]|uniref:ABC transporter ATP-binding protein n=1 Tax=Paraburkholderia sp. TaxID=1926495 RepID=UPI0039E3A6BC
MPDLSPDTTPTQTTSFISFRDVSLTLGGRQILERLSLDLRRGEFACVIGPSGCGKTTLLRLLTGLAAPSSGVILRDGVPVKGPAPDVAIVFQDYARALLPWRTVRANIGLALEALGVARAERPARIDELLHKVGLSAHADKFPAQLSGGMQQRVQIARCLAQRPAVLLMDEPFGALDAMTRQSLQDQLAELSQEAGTTVLFVTHDLEEAIYLGDRVIALQANPGRLASVIEVGLPRPRDQLGSREHPAFLRLRRELFDFIQGHEV